jgi:hypothetical protein
MGYEENNIMEDLEYLPSYVKAEIEFAYEMGFDCAVNGANTINCNFKIFNTPENTKAWEEGKRNGQKEKDNAR